MNWFNNDAGASSNGKEPASSTPDANELRRRRLAKLQEAQEAEKARRQELEARRKKWEAEKAAREASNPSPSPPPPPPPPPPETKPILVKQVKEKIVVVKKTALPSIEAATSKIVAKCLGIALTPLQAIGGMVYDEGMLNEMKQEAGTEKDPFYLAVDQHSDDILIRRINMEENQLAYLLRCFERCGGQPSEVNSNRRIAGDEHAERRSILHAAIDGLMRRVLMYTGMSLNGGFIEADEILMTDKFVEALYRDAVPAGFVRRLLQFYAGSDGPGLEEILPVFGRILRAIREKAKTEMFLSTNTFLKPLSIVRSLLSHKELCMYLVTAEDFVPRTTKDNKPMDVTIFMSLSFLTPFFQLSALPGLPLAAPLRREDPSVAATMFQNASMMDRSSVEAGIYSLRTSLAVARTHMYHICFSLCKAGAIPRNATLAWFGDLLNLNKKRSGMQVNYRDSSGDGFMMNVMHVLLKLCEPIVDGGWKLLQKIDATFPQSSHRIDYEDETRLAADSDMLKRWWVDKRNENAQASLTRQLEAATRESEMAQGAGRSDGSGSSRQVEKQIVAKEFNFVTECFWLALRAIQLGFIAVENTYQESLLRGLSRMQSMIAELEEVQSRGVLSSQQRMHLSLLKQRLDEFLGIRFCYDVYLEDEDELSIMVRFASASAEWLMKKLLAGEGRESILPLPVPADPTFASLPEHTVETMTTILLTAMRVRPQIVEENLSLLEEIVSFCIVGAASPVHVKNPYLRAKLVEVLWIVFPRGTGGLDEEDDESGHRQAYRGMEALFSGHAMSRKFLPGALFRLYVDVEHTGSHTQFYDKFSIRYRIGSIIESLWYMADYRKSVQNEARDEARFLRFVNMVLNDANHLLDSVLDDLEEMHSLEMLIEKKPAEWEALTNEEKEEKVEQLKRLEGSAKGHNQLANNNVKLLWLLTEDGVVRRIFVRDEMVSRLAEMLNYLLERLSGQRCQNLKVSQAEKVFWKPRVLLKRILQTYVHFKADGSFARAVGLDGRSYKKELIPRAVDIASRKRLLNANEIGSLLEICAAAEKAVEEENEEEAELGDIPDEFLDPIMSSLMRNPVVLPTSGSIMDRAVICRILLSDKADPFNRKLLTEDMLVEEKDLKERIEKFIEGRKRGRK